MSIQENLEHVKEALHEAVLKAGRPENSVSLVAVSKFHSEQEVREAIEAGQRIFGENRVQEAVSKFTPVLAEYPDTELHLIGSLQRNKVSRILPFASCIQSVDRVELLYEIEKRAALLDKTVSVLFEMHTGEESKAGFPTKEALLNALDSLAKCPHIQCKGLMTMAPFTDNETIVRQSFRTLKKLQEACEHEYPNLDFSTLSMGMSNDYRIAIQEGSTMVRIGTALFGGRNP